MHLSDIDMIAGTPVLDIKPYIPEYDSPHTRMVFDVEQCISSTDKPKATTVSPQETEDMLNLHCSSETDVQSNLKGERNDDEDFGSQISEDKTEDDLPNTDSSVISLQSSLPGDTLSVLEEVKAYLTQSDLQQLSCKRKYGVVDPKNTEPVDSTVEKPTYGEEAYSTIAGWIREPPVASLEVRFTPHAEKELAEFLPTHLSGKLL